MIAGGAGAPHAEAPTSPGPSSTASAEPAGEPAGVPATTSVPPSGERQTCPGCGAPNSAHRTLCGRCGTDLATGELPPRPAPHPAVAADETRDLDEGGGLDRYVRWIVLGIVGLLVLAGALAVFDATGLLPTARDRSELPVAEFDPVAYADPPEQLRIEELSTSSTLPEASRDQTFDATLMADGDLDTAWNNDGSANPHGVGEVIEAELEDAVWLSGIVVANGSQRNDATFLGNARLRRVQVTLDGGASFVAELLDRRGQQVIQLDEPELTTVVRLEVLDAHRGDTHDDLAVSEIELRGHEAGEDDRDLAEERLERRATGRG